MNEAAERLLEVLDKAFDEPTIQPVTYRIAVRPAVLAIVIEALAAERRATVERIRVALNIASARAKAREPETAWHDGYLIGIGEAEAILDAEAAL